MQFQNFNNFVKNKCKKLIIKKVNNNNNKNKNKNKK